MHNNAQHTPQIEFLGSDGVHICRGDQQGTRAVRLIPLDAIRYTCLGKWYAECGNETDER